MSKQSAKSARDEVRQGVIQMRLADTVGEAEGRRIASVVRAAQRFARVWQSDDVITDALRDSALALCRALGVEEKP